MIDNEKMRHLGEIVDKEINGDKKGKDRQFSFFLTVSEFGNNPGLANYISNITREDAIKALRETADRLEGRSDFKTPDGN